MKTLIASNERFTALQRQYAEKNNGISAGIRTLTLPAALQEHSDPEDLLLFRLKNRLSSISDRFPVYRDMFRYPSFLKEILAFTRKCILYDISEDELPVSDENEKELKNIIHEALQDEYAWAFNRNSRDRAVENLIHRNDLMICPQFLSEPYYYRIQEKLKSGIPVLKEEEKYPAVSLRYALTARQELEAIAQDICMQGKTCNVVLTDSSLQYPLIQMIFERYGIPYCCYSAGISLRTPVIFSSLLRCAVKEDTDTLEKACMANAFDRSLSDPVRHYLFSHFDDLYSHSLLGNTLKEDPVFHDMADMYALAEEKALTYLNSILPDLERIHNAATIQEKVLACYEILKKHSLLQIADERNATVSLKNIIQNILPMIRTEEDVLFLSDYVEGLSFTTVHEDSDFCIITDLTHPVSTKQITYVVSTDGSGYPGVPSESGLFDEKYLMSVSSCPDQVYRNEIYMDQLHWIENSAEEQLIYSWHTNDYQGREVQLSLEIEQAYSSIKEPWKLAVLPPEPVVPHSISPETAAVLFQKDDAITGSISTIERYFHCPYSYFIQSGLHIRKPDYGDLSSAGIGTIQHYIFESAVQNHHKKYAEISEEEVRSYIRDSFVTMQKMHPQKKEQIQLSKERMVHGIMLVLKFLNAFENSTSFEPAETELSFCEEIIEGVRLRGIIDRMDFYGSEMFRIIDYKSSVHTLSETKIKAGVQLQLLSYAMIAEKLTGRMPAGAYYCSLKQENVPVPAAKKNRKEIEETDFSPETDEKRMMDARKLIGWTFTDRTTELDESESHVATIRKQRDYELIRTCMQEIYTYFREHLLNGEIDLSPDEDACAFCDYRSICRYHGEYRKISPVAGKDVKFDKGKE